MLPARGSGVRQYFFILIAGLFFLRIYENRSETDFSHNERDHRALSLPDGLIYKMPLEFSPLIEFF